MKSVATGLGMLLLAGCLGQPPEQQSGAAADAIGANLAVRVNAPAAVESAQDRPPVKDGRIPTAFQGRWGLVPADCTSTRGDNKGLMTVSADRLTFYESRATIAGIDPVSATRLNVSLAFTGEGQEWKQDTPLVLEDSGNLLTRVADGQTLRYRRCGA